MGEIDRRQPPDLLPENTETIMGLGKALRQILYIDAQSFADRIFDRVEERIGRLVDDAARRIVPQNIRSLISTTTQIKAVEFERRVEDLKYELERLRADCVSKGISKERRSMAKQTSRRYRRTTPRGKRK